MKKLPFKNAKKHDIVYLCGIDKAKVVENNSSIGLRVQSLSSEKTYNLSHKGISMYECENHIFITWQPVEFTANLLRRPIKKGDLVIAWDDTDPYAIVGFAISSHTNKLGVNDGCGSIFNYDNMILFENEAQLKEIVAKLNTNK